MPNTRFSRRKTRAADFDRSADEGWVNEADIHGSRRGISSRRVHRAEVSPMRCLGSLEGHGSRPSGDLKKEKGDGSPPGEVFEGLHSQQQVAARPEPIQRVRLLDSPPRQD